MRKLLLLIGMMLGGLAIGCGEEPTPVTPAAKKMPATSATQPSAVCLPCKMTVTPTDKTPSAEYQGHTYHFCSEHCKTSFEKDPAKFVNK